MKQAYERRRKRGRREQAERKDGEEEEGKYREKSRRERRGIRKEEKLDEVDRTAEK